MRKTSVYLNEADLERLQSMAEREGRSQAEIIRAAISAYELQSKPDRNFALAGSWAGDGTSVANIPEDELMRGFGEDSRGELGS